MPVHAVSLFGGPEPWDVRKVKRPEGRAPVTAPRLRYCI